jgi:hypothetical protein
MDSQSKLAAMLDLAEEFGLPVRRVPSAGDSPDHPGGAVVRLKGKDVIFLDPTAATEDQVTVVASALRGRKELDSRFLPPEVREAIDGA